MGRRSQDIFELCQGHVIASNRTFADILSPRPAPTSRNCLQPACDMQNFRKSVAGKSFGCVSVTDYWSDQS